MSKILLETINLRKTYKHFNGNINLFTNLNLKIKQGDLVALVGPSGSGKSSLLHLLALLDVPTKGDIKINNVFTRKFTNDEKDEIRRKNISIIFQDNNLLNDFTAIENVMMPLIIKGESRENAENKAKTISAGEQQRVAIARAIIAETNIILADEPTGNLDYKTSKEIFSYFLKLKKLKKTIIFATHNRELANRADYKLFISNGDIKRVNAR